MLVSKRKLRACLFCRLQDLGAVSFYPSVEADEVDGLESTVDPWVENIIGALQKALQELQQQPQEKQQEAVQAAAEAVPAAASRPVSAVASAAAVEAAAVAKAEAVVPSASLWPEGT